MDFLYETNRLILKVLDVSYANDILLWYSKNRFDFDQYEPKRSDKFYTEEFHYRLLELENEYMLKGEMFRFYAFFKDDPKTILGTISIRNISRGPYQSCEIGYKVDSKFRRIGIGYEMVKKACDLVFEDLDLHRIEATCLPWNKPSYTLLEKIGFEREGLMRKSCEINGQYEDLYLYSLINE